LWRDASWRTISEHTAWARQIKPLAPWVYPHLVANTPIPWRELHAVRPTPASNQDETDEEYQNARLADELLLLAQDGSHIRTSQALESWTRFSNSADRFTALAAKQSMRAVRQ